MIRESADVLVLGSGFAGSLTALLLQRIGKRVVLVDRGKHPRFAIGESSTPLADLTLRRLAERYDLPRLLPLTRYGDWKGTYPEITCGLKRGFSYFAHRPGEWFSTDEQHSHELLVAASSCDEVADTHWLRADVDAFLFAEARREGVVGLEECELACRSRGPWVWSGTRLGEPVEIQAEFIIDATGEAGIVAKAVGATCDREGFRTRSRCLFGHFKGVQPWEDLLDECGHSTADYPFACDAAAVHHLLDEGWMWQLRFDNGLTSIGLVLDAEPSTLTPHQEFMSCLGRYPSLGEQLEYATLVTPRGSLQSTGRLQRRWSPCAGADWALLPGTAGFIDPLHSTGLAHSMFGIERLVRTLETTWENSGRLGVGLEAYNRAFQSELSLIDSLVAACYATRRNFPAFVAATMLYFTAVTTCERRVLAGRHPAFLAADDRALVDTLTKLCDWLRQSADSGELSAAEIHDVVRAAIAPWNQVGLLDPRAMNLYRHAVPVTK